jgi:hypothetical protein
MADAPGSDELDSLLQEYDQRKRKEQQDREAQQRQEWQRESAAGAVLQRIVQPVAEGIASQLNTAGHATTVAWIEDEGQTALVLSLTLTDPIAQKPLASSSTLTFLAEGGGQVTVGADVHDWAGRVPALHSMAAASGTVEQDAVTEEWARTTILGFLRQVLNAQ